MMPRPPKHGSWTVGQTVRVGSLSLRVIAAHHDDRASTFALAANDGTTYRYAPPLKLFKTK